MSGITNVALAVQSMGKWNPGDLAFIEKLEYRSGNDNQLSSVVIVGVMQRRDQARDGWPSETAPSFRATLFFDGVRDLEIKGFGGHPKQIMGFDIVDVSDKGWEGIAFAVEDSENGALQFSCSAINIVDIVRI